MSINRAAKKTPQPQEQNTRFRFRQGSIIRNIDLEEARAILGPEFSSKAVEKTLKSTLARASANKSAVWFGQTNWKVVKTRTGSNVSFRFIAPPTCKRG